MTRALTVVALTVILAGSVASLAALALIADVQARGMTLVQIFR